jgi:hypothetical protein
VNVSDRFEFATDADPSLSYCLWDYPRRSDAADKFRSINLLFHSFALAGIDARVLEIVEALRDAIGPFRTVYGVKWASGKYGWELYFYDYKRRERNASAARVIDAIRPWVGCEAALAETLPYFMFSIDLDDDIVCGHRPLDVIHMYVGNPGSAVSSGIAYGVRAQTTTLENFYFFFDAQTELTQAARKIETSALIDVTRIDLDEILVPELKDCRTICVANKATHDCVYFSGVNVEQLVFFLERMRYPAPTIELVERNRARLDHLMFDVGFDYTMRDGKLVALKSAYYGVF